MKNAHDRPVFRIDFSANAYAIRTGFGRMFVHAKPERPGAEQQLSVFRN